MATTPVNGKNNPLGSLPGPMPSDASNGASIGASKTNAAKTAEANLAKDNATGGAGGGKTPPNFNVNISSSAKDRADASQKALNIARNTPDIREDKVAALKAQIDAGTYKVDAGKVADGMMREAIKEHLSELDER